MVKSSIFSTNSEAAERLNDIIEQSFDGIFITDGNATVIKINHAYETITGLSKEDLLGRNMEDLVNEKIISQSGSLIVKESKQPVTLQQYFKTKKQALITSSPIFDKSGNLIMIVTNVRDLTEIYNLKRPKKRRKSRTFKIRTNTSSRPCSYRGTNNTGRCIIIRFTSSQKSCPIRYNCNFTW